MVLQVNSVHVSPVDCNLLLTGSNDWTARLFDMRRIPSSVGSSSDSSSNGACMLSHTSGHKLPCRQ